MRARTKSRIAFGVAGGIALAAIALAAVTCWFGVRASSTDPDPEGVAESVEYALPDGTTVETEGVDWAYWLSVNPDIVGWLRIPGTTIDYPIIHAPEWDPDYYLSHDVYGGYNPMGAIYLDCGSEGLLTGGNAVIFGHHWSGDRMFSAVAGYSDEDWAREHDVVLLLTPDGATHVLRVQCADVVPGSDPVKRTNFDGEADLMAYWRERFDASCTRLAGTAAETDQLFTLVTCSYNFWPSNERTIVFAVEEQRLEP